MILLRGLSDHHSGPFRSSVRSTGFHSGFLSFVPFRSLRMGFHAADRKGSCRCCSDSGYPVMLLSERRCVISILMVYGAYEGMAWLLHLLNSYQGTIDGCLIHYNDSLSRYLRSDPFSHCKSMHEALGQSSSTSLHAQCPPHPTSPSSHPSQTQTAHTSSPPAPVREPAPTPSTSTPSPPPADTPSAPSKAQF